MSDATTTDLYEVTMAMSYLREGMTGPATFSLFVRELPSNRGFLVTAGLESALDYLTGLRVGSEDIATFAAALHRPSRDLEPLLGLGFTGHVRAVPEGRIVLAGEPLLEVTAPLPQAQLVETYVLNQLSHQTAIASKAARCVLAAAGHPVVDFSLRRTHGPQAGYQAARLSAMVGFAGTSNVAAATAQGVPAVGTMAHSFVEAFATEEEAFRAFARAHPGPVTLLVDTYDTETDVTSPRPCCGTWTAGPARRYGWTAATSELWRYGREPSSTPPACRTYGSSPVGVSTSTVMDDLIRSGAPIDTYAVGTRVGVSADAPYLDSADNMVEYDGRPVMKLSSAKVTAPGQKQVFRRMGYDDVIGLVDEQPPDDGRPLLETVMRDGRRMSAHPSLDESRERFTADLAELPPAARRIRAPVAPRATASERLSALADQVRRRITEETQARAARPGSLERSTFGSHRSVPK